MLLVRCETNRELSCKSATSKPIGPVEMHPGIDFTHICCRSCLHTHDDEIPPKAYVLTVVWCFSRVLLQFSYTRVFPLKLLHLSVFTLSLFPGEIQACFLSGLSSSVCFPFRRTWTWSVKKIPSGCSAFLSLIVRYFWYLYIRLFSMTSFETFVVRKRRKKREISGTCCVRMIRCDRVEQIVIGLKYVFIVNVDESYIFYVGLYYWWRIYQACWTILLI